MSAEITFTIQGDPVGCEECGHPNHEAKMCKGRISFAEADYGPCECKEPL